MAKYCCRTMENFCRTAAEREVILTKSGIDTVNIAPLPEPLVELTPKGIFIIRGIAIFYCPWCGEKLPTLPEGPITKNGHAIVVAIDTKSTVTVDGEPLKKGENLEETLKKRIEGKRRPFKSSPEE